MISRQDLRNIAIRLLSWGGLLLILLILFLGALYLRNIIREGSDPGMVVPDGTVRKAPQQVLESFGFAKQGLPFYEESHVIQSLELLPEGQPRQSSLPIQIGHVSYWVQGPSTAQLRQAYVEYFQSLGWRLTSNEPSTLSFLNGDASRAADVLFVDRSLKDGTITITLTIRRI